MSTLITQLSCFWFHSLGGLNFLLLSYYDWQFYLEIRGTLLIDGYSNLLVTPQNLNVITIIAAVTFSVRLVFVCLRFLHCFKKFTGNLDTSKFGFISFKTLSQIKDDYFKEILQSFKTFTRKPIETMLTSYGKW